jgi:beta-N-acetylhexosaminidase
VTCVSTTSEECPVDGLSGAVHGILVPGFEGRTAVLPSWVRRRLDDGLAGVVLFARNIDADVRALTDAVHAGRPAALVAIDEEGGDVTRLEAASGARHPGALALGALDDRAATRRVGASIGAMLAEAGVDWNWAPVADVMSGPRNPVVGVRSFGTDAHAVGRHVAATVRGLQDDAGILACAKHFPGHGDTDVDSHLGLPTVSSTRAELEAGALVPFRAAIDAGVASVMTGHLRMLGVDPDLPATFSPVVLRSLLRDDLGFSGVVVSDALEMRGATTGHGIGEAAVLAVRAGVDALCLGGHLADDDVVALVHDALVAAVLRGDLEESRVVDAAARVAGLGDRRSSGRASTGSGTTSVERRSGAGVLDLAECTAIAARALAVTGTVALAEGPVLVVVCDPAASIPAGVVPWGVTDQLRTRRESVVELLVPERDPAPDAVGHVGPIVLVLRDAARHRWQRAVESAIVERRPDTVVVELGVPADPPPSDAARITAYGASRSSTDAVVALLTDPEGRP